MSSRFYQKLYNEKLKVPYQMYHLGQENTIILAKGVLTGQGLKDIVQEVVNVRTVTPQTGSSNSKHR